MDEAPEVTPTQASSMLGISLSQVRALMDRGLLQVRTVGTRHRVSVASIVAFRETERKRSRAAMADLAALQNALGLTE